jgi:hypothetical protein
MRTRIGSALVSLVLASLPACGGGGLDGSGHAGPALGEPIALAAWNGPDAYLEAPNAASFNSFGGAVAVSGDTMVVGAFRERSPATGVGGDPTQVDGATYGAAYVFVRDGSGGWEPQAYLKPSNTDEEDGFGFSVAIDRDTIVVGAQGEDGGATGVNGASDESANGSGAAYVFVRGGTAWKQEAYLKASNASAGDLFGYAVAVSGDLIVVGAFAEDGASVGVNGDATSDGAVDSGAAYAFVRREGRWSQEAYLKASNSQAGDGFGLSVAVSGETVAIGAPHEDGGSSGVDGNPASNGLANSGAAYVFERRSGRWRQQAYLKASNPGSVDLFGWALAVDRDTLVAGAPTEDSRANEVDGDASNDTAPSAGAAYVFLRQSGQWGQQAYLKGSKTESLAHFGFAVAASGDVVAVGAPAVAAGNPGKNAELAYVFERSDGTWAEAGFVTSFDVAADDEFGTGVALDSDGVVVGAPKKDGEDTGAGATASGAVYVFPSP